MDHMILLANNHPAFFSRQLGEWLRKLPHDQQQGFLQQWDHRVHVLSGQQFLQDGQAEPQQALESSSSPQSSPHPGQEAPPTSETATSSRSAAPRLPLDLTALHQHPQWQTLRSKQLKERELMQAREQQLREALRTLSNPPADNGDGASGTSSQAARQQQETHLRNLKVQLQLHHHQVARLNLRQLQEQQMVAAAVRSSGTATKKPAEGEHSSLLDADADAEADANEPSSGQREDAPRRPEGATSSQSSASRPPPALNPTALQRHPQWHTLRMKQMKERQLIHIRGQQLGAALQSLSASSDSKAMPQSLAVQRQVAEERRRVALQLHLCQQQAARMNLQHHQEQQQLVAAAAAGYGGPPAPAPCVLPSPLPMPPRCDGIVLHDADADDPAEAPNQPNEGRAASGEPSPAPVPAPPVAPTATDPAPATALAKRLRLARAALELQEAGFDLSAPQLQLVRWYQTEWSATDPTGDR